MYQAFYKLHGKPFQLTPDPAMLFPSKGHKRAMSYLLYGLEQGEGFVMITGAVGTGKTLLIQKLFEELARRDIAMAGIASANLDGEDILPAVASAFGLPYDGRSKEALLQDLKSHLLALRDRHSHALLVVDEAQTLTATALEMLRILSNFEVKGHALLQVFLVGQAELRRTIIDNRMEQLRQRIIASHKLEPMAADECREYILHRLRTVAGSRATSTSSWTGCCCMVIWKRCTTWTRPRSPSCSTSCTRKWPTSRRRWRHPRRRAVRTPRVRTWRPSWRPGLSRSTSGSATTSCCS